MMWPINQQRTHSLSWVLSLIVADESQSQRIGFQFSLSDSSECDCCMAGAFNSGVLHKGLNNRPAAAVVRCISSFYVCEFICECVCERRAHYWWRALFTAARTARRFLESQHEEAPLDFIIVQDQASMASLLQQNNRLCDTPNCSCSKLMVPDACFAEWAKQGTKTTIWIHLMRCKCDDSRQSTRSYCIHSTLYFNYCSWIH